MNHLPTEEEDRGFQEGYRTALYLETHPCPHRENGHCPDCISDAVEAVENALRADAEKNAAELRRIIDLRKKWPTEII